MTQHEGEALAVVSICEGGWLVTVGETAIGFIQESGAVLTPSGSTLTLTLEDGLSLIHI